MLKLCCVEKVRCVIGLSDIVSGLTEISGSGMLHMMVIAGRSSWINGLLLVLVLLTGCRDEKGSSDGNAGESGATGESSETGDGAGSGEVQSLAGLSV